MPILNVSVSKTVDESLAARIATELTDLTHRYLRKDPTVTAVAVTGIDAHHWYAGGRSLASQRSASFWLDIKVVDGTNTKQEMQAYLAAVYAAMSEILSPLHTESYVLVHEVAAHAYGFGGRTQEFRSVAKELETAAKLRIS